ncbi:hypothetical protein DL766_002360 [Monosporascus sp. MC13-8B]|nr:hypothetical protein DL766_002360 [Monosporascus sp. MC13-8B]
MLMSTPFTQLAIAVGVLLGTAQSGPVSIMSVLEARAIGFQAIPQQLLDMADLDATCLQVLKQTINCEEKVADLGQREYHGSLEDDKLTDAVCAASCKTALNTARRHIIDAWEEYEEIEDMPENDLCSYCYGAKLRLMQKSEYSAYDEYYAAMLEYVNKKCGVDSPTTPIKEPPQNNGSQPGTCFSGRTIATREGDSCDSVAIANSVSAASLYYINANLPDCKSIEAGLELCLPEPCTTHTVKEGETCVALGVESGTSWMNLIDWNHMLDSRCSNLWNSEPFWGHVICVSPPGGEFEDGGSGGDGGDPGNGNTGGEGGSGNGYSETIVDPPEGEIGEGTTKNCGFYVQAQEGVGCAKTIVTASRSTPMDLFLEVNPSLGSAAKCDSNLKPGVWYCLSPHYYWDEEQPKP